MTGKRLPLNTTGARSVFDLASAGSNGVDWQAPPAAAPEPAPPPAPAANKVPAPAGAPLASAYTGPINPAAVKIHSDIPLPKGRTNRSSVSDALLQRMKPGQVVFLPRPNAASLLAYAKRVKIKVAARQMHKDPRAVAEAGPDAVGVWRLE